jgi:hypothetical protein
MRLVTQTSAPEPQLKPEVPSEPAIIPVGLHKACPSCHEVFPEHMMDRHGELLLCKPCRHQAEVDAAKPKRPSYIAHLSSESIVNWGIGIAIVTAILFVGVRIVPSMMLQKATGDKIEAARKWAREAASKWPTLSMQIAPSEGNAMPSGWQLGPNACLVERDDGTVLCVTGVIERSTPEDALRRAAGDRQVTPPTPIASFDEFSRGLSAAALTAANGRATFTKLLPDNRGAFERGVLFFGQPSGLLPKGWNTLRMRETEYFPGMKMTVLARDPKSGAQVPLEAMVASSNLSQDLAALSADQIHKIGRKPGDGSESLFTLTHPYPADQLIGAPVVDVRGNLAAVITLAFAPTDLEGRTTDFIAYGMHALKSHAAKAPDKKK